MLEILGKLYVIDLDGMVESCKINSNTTKGGKTPDLDTYEINVFKFELLKVCVERLLNEYNEYNERDPKLDVFDGESFSVSFKFAFNTLLKNNIIIEDEIYDI